MHRRLLVSAIGVLAIGLVAVAVWFLADRSGPHAPAASAAPSVAPAADQGPAVAAVLRRLTSDPASLVASAAAAQVGDGATKAIPAGATVTPEVASWAPDGIGGGTMLVTVTARDGRRVTYAAVMVREGSVWKVLATFPVASRAPGR